MDGDHEDCEEDPDFIDSDHDFGSEEDDIEYNRNVTDGIEIGSDGGRQNEVQEERGATIMTWMNWNYPRQRSSSPNVHVDVPTDYVNFDNVVDDLVDMENAESASMRVSRAQKRQRTKQSTSAGPNA